VRTDKGDDTQEDVPTIWEDYCNSSKLHPDDWEEENIVTLVTVVGNGEVSAMEPVMLLKTKVSDYRMPYCIINVVTSS
jgi:hypothetical protein